MSYHKNSKDAIILIPQQQLSKEWFDAAIAELNEKNSIFISQQQSKCDNAKNEFAIKNTLLEIKLSIDEYQKLKSQNFGNQFKKSTINQVCKYYFTKCFSFLQSNQARENTQQELCLIDKKINYKDQKLTLEEISSYYVEIVNILIELVQNYDKLYNQVLNELQQLQKERRHVQVNNKSSQFESKSKIMPGEDIQFNHLAKIVNQKINLQRDIQLNKSSQFQQNQKIMPGEEIKFNHFDKIVNQKIQPNEPIKLSVPRSPTILLISQRDTDKSFVMKSLFPQMQTQTLVKYYQQDLESFVIDTNLFNFKQIDERERSIKQFKTIFADNSNQYFCIWLVVKFERLDIMKDYFMLIYRYIKDLNIPISMLITDFHLSGEIQQDENDIKVRFQQYNLQQFIFLGQNTCQEEMVQKLKQTLPSYLKIKNTMFEEDDPMMQNKMLEDLKQKFAIN